ncbi:MULTISPECIES: DUF4198 domain-containing protein [Terasakiella]|uniref:ABC transporter substrate-binding protein n=1 Tax=Terasakiella brassicae TaxID=1634917 RepID=A0A917C144_9PROT|nr:DUF4198 domain-containing protein [Terasakiella brassicae]GGF65500.1 ABC transporter substrate-binding protein [Terasakiella brassicae]
MLRKSIFAAAMVSVLSMAQQANAHFQLIYTPEINIKKAGEVPLKLVFWHPMSNGHTMAMGEPVEFYSVFKGKKTDLKPTLNPITFKGLSNEATAYDASVTLKRNGDYALVAVPAPYYEESEDIYIQQITKVIINKGDVPTNWSEPLGLKTEIVPLSKPYGALVGSTFSGVVLKNGQPAPGVEIEIEHMIAEPDMNANKPQNAKVSEVPGGAIVALTDAQGKFSFGIPKAGYWGFAALGVGPDSEFNAKELSQDAVLWIKAHTLED